MSGAVQDRAERRQGLFRDIARTAGGARALFLNPAVLNQAQANLAIVTPEALQEVRREVERLKGAAAARSDPALIWTIAHDLRGLAGVVGLDSVGAAAGAIRWYGQELPDVFEPNWELINALVRMVDHASRLPEDSPVETIATICREAVAKQLTREGRPVLADAGL
jgi:hypothetical protein